VHIYVFTCASVFARVSTYACECMLMSILYFRLYLVILFVVVIMVVVGGGWSVIVCDSLVGCWLVDCDCRLWCVGYNSISGLTRQVLELYYWLQQHKHKHKAQTTNHKEQTTKYTNRKEQPVQPHQAQVITITKHKPQVKAQSHNPNPTLTLGSV